MSGRIVVCGSIAYDHVMNYMGKFEDSLTGTDLSKLSVSFLALNRDVHFGGCSTNIAYNLSLLGVSPIVAGVVGKDFDVYRQWLVSKNINVEYLKELADQMTASGFILSDEVENQMAIFAPEALADFEEENFLETIGKDHKIDIVCVSPDFPARMNKHVDDCQRLNFKYIFDPGQQIGLLNEGDLKKAIEGSELVIVNSFEADLLAKKLKLTFEEIAELSGKFIITQGAEGSDFYHDGELTKIKACKPDSIVDPTGCGDAFRAGILKAIAENDDLIHGCRIGAAIASYAIEAKGTQNHQFTLNDLVKRIGLV